MLTEKEIQEQIDNDIAKYNESIYDGFLPQLFLDYYKKSLMVIPPGQHQYNMGKVKAMISKRPDEVTVVEVSMMINLIYGCPFKELYDTAEQGIDTTMEFDKVRDGFNQKTKAIEDSLIRKKQALMKIAGLDKGTRPLNNLIKVGEA